MSGVLDTSELTVGYRRGDGELVVVVKGVALRLESGRILGLAGESGCGKSTAALAAIGFRAHGAERLDGRSLLDGTDLYGLDPKALRRVWGKRIAYVAQDASLALDPLRRVSSAFSEPMRLHLGLASDLIRERSLAMLESVGIADQETALRRYPHQFSGGQQQRIALAVAMACEPEVLVLDEPTTGLDVTTQAQITGLVKRLVRESGTAAVAISHDLALLATMADEIAIMYAGEIVELASAEALASEPRHPYTAALLDAAPRVDETAVMVGIPGLPPPSVVESACAFAPRCRFAHEVCTEEHPALEELAAGRLVRCLRSAELGPVGTGRHAADGGRPTRQNGAALLEVRDVVCSYPGPHRARAQVVQGVSMEVAPGETLGIVGESGSGKSTLLRAIAGLHPADSGTIEFAGAALAPRAAKRSRELRRAIQIVFQNPDASLNPRHTVESLVDRPLRLFRPDLDRRGRTAELDRLLADVRLDPSVASRYPDELSGGQKQRVALARAFAAGPRLILCDEVVSALDVSVQAAILELLGKLAAERDVALLFVTHDLAVVRSIADRICVMRGGELCESGATEQLFRSPEHPYTRELLAAVPRFGDAQPLMSESPTEGAA